MARSYAPKSVVPRSRSVLPKALSAPSERAKPASVSATAPKPSDAKSDGVPARGARSRTPPLVNEEPAPVEATPKGKTEGVRVRNNVRNKTSDAIGRAPPYSVVKGEAVAAGERGPSVPRELPDGDIDMSLLGLGARSPRREAFMRYVGIAITVSAIVCVAVFAWPVPAPVDRAPSPGSLAGTPSPAPPPSISGAHAHPAPAAASVAPRPLAPPATAAAPSSPAQPAVVVVSAPAPAPPPRPSPVHAAPAVAPVRSPNTASSAAASPSPSSVAAEPSGGDGFLNINSLPASLVLLDGKPIGSTPKVHVEVTPGVHKVVFTNSELGVMKEVAVTVGAGETKLASARLRDGESP
jgi:hypothetical protein